MTIIDDAVDVLLETDSYKLGHKNMYVKNTEVVYSNLTARGTRNPDITYGTVFFGLQAFLYRLTEKWNVFFNLSTADMEEALDKYTEFVDEMLGPNNVGNEQFRELHELGHLPLRVRAFREGSIVPLRVPYFTIENTDERFFWLTNYLETAISANMWHPITSATIAWSNRRLLDERAALSSDTALVDFQGHDFSYRGMEGDYAAAASGAGHLVSFKGTDTLPAIRFAKRYYNGDNGLVGCSVPATEHAVMCSGIAVYGEGDRLAGEVAVFEQLLDQHPEGILSVVSDSFDLWGVCTKILPALKDKIMARDGKLVIRPDSGDPELILCGDPDAPEGTPQRAGAINLLAEVFGTTVNNKGYKELDSHIGAIYGDSINRDRADAITANLMRQGYASTSSVFGFGSFTYQFQTRDTFKMAVKATWTQVGGRGYDILKDPITDDGSKKSATGRLAVRRMMNGEPYLIQNATPEQEANQELELVYENGAMLRHQSFADVRETLARETELLARREGVNA